LRQYAIEIQPYLCWFGSNWFYFSCFGQSLPPRKINGFFHPETDPLGIGYQVRQTLISIGSGGFLALAWV